MLKIYCHKTDLLLRHTFIKYIVINKLILKIYIYYFVRIGGYQFYVITRIGECIIDIVVHSMPAMHSNLLLHDIGDILINSDIHSTLFSVSVMLCENINVL